MGLVLLFDDLGARRRGPPDMSLTFDTGPLKSRRTDQNIFSVFQTTRSNFDCLPTTQRLDYYLLATGY